MASTTLRLCCWLSLAGCFLLLNDRVSVGASFTYSNSNFITINDSVSPPTTASPYPSSISVSGFAGQEITKATVILNGFSHAFPSDVSVFLVGPLGQGAIL